MAKTGISRGAAALFLSTMLAGCASNDGAHSLWRPLSFDRKPTVETMAAATDLSPKSPVISNGPLTPLAGPVPAKIAAPPRMSGQAQGLAIEQMPLPAFIDTVFGQVLGLTYQVDPQIASRMDLVTLRTGGDRKPDELFAVAQEVLKTYGVRVFVDGDVTRIVPDQALAAEIPQVIRGRTAVDVPQSLRPIFQVVPINNVSGVEMTNWVTAMVGKKLQVISLTSGNTIVLFGLQEDVRAALDAVRILDQPRFAGRQSLRVEPVYWSAERLAKKMVEVLKAEGFGASVTFDATQPVQIVPVEPSNMLLVFAGDPKTLSHVSEWLRELDRPAKADPLKTTFVYQVKNTTAASLGEVLGGVLGGSGSSSPSGSSQRSGTSTGTSQVPSLSQSGVSSSLPGQSLLASSSGQSQSAEPGVKTISTGENGARIVVDEGRNAIILNGSAEQFAQVLSLLESLDRVPREALIEVTVAEITLSDTQNLGVEWALNAALGDGYGGKITSLGGTGAGASQNPGSIGASAITKGSSGINYTVVNSLNQVRGLLTALATTSRVNILLTPRIIARSGTEALIKVGNEVPIITSQSSTSVTTSGTSALLNQVSYRTTGTILKVKPIVHSSDQIDLEIAQEVSQAIDNTNTAISSPIISNRTVETKLSMKDGSTVLLGGLISENRTSGDNGVPWLKDVPWVGNLFKSQTNSTARTELLIFITPFVVHSAEESDQLSAKFRRDMQDWPVAAGRIAP